LETLTIIVVCSLALIAINVMVFLCYKHINKQATELAALTHYTEHHCMLMRQMSTDLNHAHARLDALEAKPAPAELTMPHMSEMYPHTHMPSDECVRATTSAFTRVDGIVVERPMCTCGERKRHVCSQWACEACGEATEVRAKARTKKAALMDDLVYADTEEELLESMSMSPARVGGWSRHALRCGGQTHDQGTKPKGKSHKGGR